MQDSLRNFKAEFFKALSHPIRIKIFELLRAGELSVTDLQDRLGIESSSVSQHLSVLRHKNIVESRKAGTTVYYRVRDPEVFELLDVARRIFNNQLLVTRSTLEELEEENAGNDQDIDVKRASPISVSSIAFKLTCAENQVHYGVNPVRPVGLLPTCSLPQ